MYSPTGTQYSQMNEQQNLRCARCGLNPKEPVVVPKYSDTARHLLRPDYSEPIRSIDDESYEAAFLREELQRGRDMLSSVDKDIATLQAMLGDLQAKRDSLQRYVDDHAAILKKRFCLPPELLVNIFHLAYPVVYTDAKEGIWQLGRICSYWRSVLLSSPSLWSTMDLEWTSAVPVTEKILSLSENLPLRITLYSFDVDSLSHDGGDDEERSELFYTILEASHRWYTISLNISHSQHPLLNQLKGRIPMLTEVICGNGIPLGWLEGAPSLRKLLTGDISDCESLALPWSQLRELDCRPLTIHQEYQILRRCVNLETYRLVSRMPTGPVPSNLCMSKLRTLTIFAASHIIFMDILTVPSLDGVTIKSIFPLTEHFLSSFSNLLSRSHCFPTKLKINSDSVEMPLFSLFSLQNLTTLHVSNRFKYNLHLISTLTLHPETEDSAILLPRLEHLDLRPYRVDSDDLTSVIDMVRSRWHLHERVKVVSRLAFFAFLPQADERPLQLRGTLIPLLAFSEEGLEMVIDRFYLEKVDRTKRLDYEPKK